jgi:hypothetical protein
MPTGYTYPVVDGKITEFPDFALSCARAFGALISMREEPADAPIPEEFTPATGYYDKRIEAGRARLAEVLVMTTAESDAAALAEHEKAIADRDRYLADKEVEASRVRSMLAKVEAWEPPSSDHEEMKRFMIDQLHTSLPGDYVPAVPERVDGAAWRSAFIAQLDKQIARDKEERAKEIERASGRTEWVKKLRASLSRS